MLPARADPLFRWRVSSTQGLPNAGGSRTPIKQQRAAITRPAPSPAIGETVKGGWTAWGAAAKVTLAHAIVTRDGWNLWKARSRAVLHVSWPVWLVQCGNEVPTAALTASLLVP